jgi:hypothetical protein
MNLNLEAVKQLAKDLRKNEPRSPDEELGGYPLAARCLDKCRATLVGWQGEYTYGCPMDQQFLSKAGIQPGAFKDYVATGASDADVAKWIKEQARQR